MSDEPKQIDVVCYGVDYPEGYDTGGEIQKFSGVRDMQGFAIQVFIDLDNHPPWVLANSLLAVAAAVAGVELEDTDEGDAEGQESIEP